MTDETRPMAEEKLAGEIEDARCEPPSLAELQREIIENRRKRGWASAKDIEKTVLGLAEEVGELARAVRDLQAYDGTLSSTGIKGAAKELADIIIFALGGLEILGVDGHTLVNQVVAENANRVYQTHH